MGHVPIDLNADVGEGLDSVDAALMPLVTSVNVACGGHAGDLQTMRHALVGARDHGVAIGAHPSYPDRSGFGRIPMSLTADELAGAIGRQLTDLAAVASETGVTLTHVKPHGALYGRAATDAATASIVAEVVAAFDSGLAVVALAGSRLLDAGRAAGLRVIAEAFADRAYEPDGSLRARGRPGAVHSDPATVAAQALSIAAGGRVGLSTGASLDVEAETICLHSDSPGAVENARHIRSVLDVADIEVASFSRTRA